MFCTLFPRQVRDLTVLLACLLVLFKIDAKAQNFEVSGEVLDRQNKPIESVMVTVFRGNTNVGEDRTKNGKYTIKFSAGSTIKIIYDHSSYIAGKVEDLSGQRDHSIKKVLRPIGSSFSLSEGREVLATYDLIFDVQRANNVSASELRKAHGFALQGLFWIMFHYGLLAAIIVHFMLIY